MSSSVPKPVYPTKFQSKFAPKYHYQPSLMGMNFKQLSRVGVKLAGFGGVALFGVIFYVSNVPRVRKDILQNIPIVGNTFVKEPIPASDNPF